MARLVIALDSPGFGGAERDLIRLLKSIEFEARIVFLVGHHTDPEFLESLKQFGEVQICEWAGNSAKNVLAGTFAARKWVRRFSEHYFLVWSHHCDSNRWLRLYLAISRRKFTIVERAVAPTPESLTKSRLTAPLIRFISRRADRHLFCGKAQMEDFVKVFHLTKPNCKLIPNSRPTASIRSAAFQARSQREATKNDLKISTGPMLICVGRLDQNKGQIFLIRALAALKSDVNLLLVGDGPAKEELEQLASKLAPGQVTITTSSNPIPLLAAADIFVLPSLAEGLSGALIEAMAACLPCVATDIPGNRELIRHEETGLLVPVKDSEALTKAIERLLLDTDSARRLARAGYELVAKEYDERVEQAGWEKMLSALVQQKRRFPEN